MKWKWEYDGDDLEAKQTKLACNKTFNTVYFGVLNALFRFLLPTICLVVFNVLIFREVSFLYISHGMFLEWSGLLSSGVSLDFGRSVNPISIRGQIIPTK